MKGGLIAILALVAAVIGYFVWKSKQEEQLPPGAPPGEVPPGEGEVGLPSVEFFAE